MADAIVCRGGLLGGGLGRVSYRLVGVARTGLVVGGLVGLVITPAFSLAYFAAHEPFGSPPGWLESVDLSLVGAGGGSVAIYERHGIAYGLALLVVVVSLVVVVRTQVGMGRRQRRAWIVIVSGLGAVTAGTIGEYGVFGSYGISSDFWTNNAFGLELLGFLVIAVGTVLLGWALKREEAVSVGRSTGIAAVGAASLVLGTVIVGHIPSGAASLLLIAAIVVGVTGRAKTVSATAEGELGMRT